MIMVYKVKHSHKRLPKDYFRERELKEVTKKNKKHFSINRTSLEGSRYALHTNEETHKKGAVVDIDGQLGVVEKVSRKGVYVQKYTSNKGFFEKTTKKPVFIKERDYEKRAFPFYTKEVIGSLMTPSKIPVRI
jgi:hypothetical protein